MKKNLLIPMAMLPMFSMAQNWLPVGSGLRSAGNNKEVNVLHEFNGQLIAGGKMEKMNGPDSLYRVARFDGTDWRQMGVGGGFNNQVHDFAEFNGQLYATGQFTRKYLNDGVNFDGRIARWDGTTWQPVPGASGQTGTALTVWDGKLCLAHDLYGGNNVENRVSCYDGSTWEDLPGVFKGPVNYAGLSDLCVYQGNLVAVGRFDSLGMQPIRMVAVWDGSQWLDPEFPVNGRSELSPDLWIIEGDALTCEVIEDDLFVGGLFPTFNHPDNDVTGLASWDGSDWTGWSFGDSPGQTIRDIVQHGDSIFAIGDFELWHPVTNDYVWGAVTFHPDSSYFFYNTNFFPVPEVGVGSFEVMCGISFDGSLYVGGDFTHAGTNQVNNITRFDPDADFPTGVVTVAAREGFRAHPNPFADGLTVEVQGTAVVTLHNILGEEVLTQTVNGRNVIHTETLPAGVYFFRDSTNANVVRVVKQ